ncbi:MAG TPA: hypothetical protein DDW79_06955 [Anaerolineae bacterium]|nr:hypothetical protein [Anaerolineae bacterium]
MRLIKTCLNPKTKSTAEKRLFQEFQKNNWSDTIRLHSLELPEHEYKGIGELDFIRFSTGNVCSGGEGRPNFLSGRNMEV